MYLAQYDHVKISILSYLKYVFSWNNFNNYITIRAIKLRKKKKHNNISQNNNNYNKRLNQSHSTLFHNHNKNDENDDTVYGDHFNNNFKSEEEEGPSKTIFFNIYIYFSYFAPNTSYICKISF